MEEEARNDRDQQRTERHKTGGRKDASRGQAKAAANGAQQTQGETKEKSNPKTNNTRSSINVHSHCFLASPSVSSIQSTSHTPPVPPEAQHALRRLRLLQHLDPGRAAVGGESVADDGGRGAGAVAAEEREGVAACVFVELVVVVEASIYHGTEEARCRTN